jgi:HD-GYP domain-containing protein (c-di-GMP phosphodiesterase class II)
MRAAQLLLGFVTGGAAKAVSLAVSRLPAFELLGTTSLAFVVGAVLFGWPGLVGVTALHVVWATLRGSSPQYVAVSAVVYMVAGAAVYLVFRSVRGIGRGMPNLRSLLVYALTAGTGAVVTGGTISLAFQEGWEAAALWSRSTVVSVVVFGPPLLILGERLLKRWLAPVPGEVPVRRRAAFATAEGRLRGDLPGVVRLPEPDRPRSLALGGAMILLVAAATLAADRVLPASGFWVGLLYLVPVFWACRRHRLRGGLVAAGGAGLAFLAVESFTVERLAPEVQRIHELASYAYLLVFVAVGAIVGAAWERETDLLEYLFESNRRLRTDLERVVRALSGAVEAKDLYTEGHLQRVSGFAVAVGRRLGLSEAELERLRIASALHDVGKIGIPEHVLNKPGPLDPVEREVVERHPEIGARILESVEDMAQVAPLVLHHQERWDGRRDGEFPGYPLGLAGEAIPLGARIIAVVDAFDAMTTDRTYRRAFPVERAASVLRAEAGRQFDPRVVEEFLAVLEQRPWE